MDVEINLLEQESGMWGEMWSVEGEMRKVKGRNAGVIHSAWRRSIFMCWTKKSKVFPSYAHTGLAPPACENLPPVKRK